MCCTPNPDVQVPDCSKPLHGKQGSACERVVWGSYFLEQVDPVSHTSEYRKIFRGRPSCHQHSPHTATVAMRTVRQIILTLSFLMGLWVIGSFVGVMLNVSNPGFWTTSLMWSLLASVLVMPALVVAHHANTRRATRKAAEQRANQAPPPQEDQPPFVEEEEREGALWPEPENHSSQR